MTKKILITGGLGFIGSHLAIKLSQKSSYQITVVDAEKYFFEKGINNYQYFKNIRKQQLLNNSVNIIEADLLNKDKIDTLFEEIKPDIIIHLASISVAGIADYFPQLAKENIFDSTFNLLQTIVNKSHVERFIYISSSMVYGHFPKDVNGNIIPPNEETPCNPIDIYGTFKLCGEHLLKAYHFRKNLPYVIIRPTAVYGFGDCNFRVSELFIANALLHRPIVLDNGGQHQLDFTYVNDIVNGIALTIENSDALNQTFNISFGKGHSISEFANIIKQFVPETTITKSDSKPFRPNRGALDISKAKSLLQFVPEHPIEKGIKIYLDKLNEHIDHLVYPDKYF
jgi:nucleoside-diphosphate-sugar epimerase